MAHDYTRTQKGFTHWLKGRGGIFFLYLPRWVWLFVPILQLGGYIQNGFVMAMVDFAFSEVIMLGFMGAIYGFARWDDNRVIAKNPDKLNKDGTAKEATDKPQETK